MGKLGSKDFRNMGEEEAGELAEKVKRHPIFLILEDILDTYNVGGFFRLAEAAAVEKVYLCGKTDVPPNPKIAKASVGTYKIVPWEHKESAKSVIEDLRKARPDGIQVIAVEQHEKSVDFRKIGYQFPLAFVFGNESWGMKPGTLEVVDQVAEVPMYGFNNSLNVMVAAGIVLFEALGKARGD